MNSLRQKHLLNLVSEVFFCCHSSNDAVLANFKEQIFAFSHLFSTFTAVNVKLRNFTTMIIGVPKEIKNNENRVGMTPAGVQ